MDRGSRSPRGRRAVRGRWAPLASALALAGGFVLLRVLYRVVFGGSGGAGVVLLDLPRVPLGGPFAHLALFGPVTTGGVLGSIVGAVPFAALVLATGVLATVLDVRALLGRAATRGPVRVVARALLVALATFPALVVAVRRARRARALRGGRSAAGVVIPVLAHTVERATAIGASMEVRGFAASPRAGEDRAPGEPLVAARSVALHREGKPVLAGVDVDVRPGDVVLLAGATGSGKSTLLRALDGSAPHLGEAAVAGELRVTGVDRLATPPRDTADLVGTVAQDVRAGFVAATVAEEIGFARAVRGDSVAEMRDRVAAVAAELDIAHLLDRDIHALSAGEASRVALAAALVGDPRVVLLDEPLADLDAESRDLVLTALRSRAARGVAVVVAEHREDAVEGLASRRWVIDGGRLEESARRLAPEAPLPRAAEDSGAPVVARVRGLSAGYGGEPVLRDIDLEIRRGEVVAIAGANGAGKSTLLDGIARTGRRGVVVVGGADVAALRPRARRLRVALVPERPDDLFVRASVAEECAGADRVLGGRGRVVRGATLHLASELAAIPSADFEALLARHPRDLSAGQRLCLALAIQATAHPDLLLVDEPVRGLDADARRLVAAALARLARRGTAVVVATHDTAFADGIAHRALLLADGALAPLRSLA